MKSLMTGAVLSAAMAMPALAADEVRLQLKWVTQAQFAGYYVALDQGFYEEEGLDVTMRPWLGNTSMESYERSNCSGCHGIGLATANRDPIRVSTDFMYFVQFETCAAWCAEVGDETCECMLPKQ